jgi:hypothetical protein
MNVTVPKQTQGATFEKKVSAENNLAVVEGGCVVLFTPNTGCRL